MFNVAVYITIFLIFNKFKKALRPRNKKTCVSANMLLIY